jgi:hypothetical protein
MKWYSAIVFAIGTAFSVALAIYPKHAPAQEVLTGRGIICDTAEQVARVIKADHFYETLIAVNADKAHSCQVMEVAFIVHGEKGETVRIHSDAWQVTQIIVVGAHTPQGWGTVEATIQWTALHVDEQSA